MYRARRRDLGSSFTFGGRIPASVGLLLVLVVVATLGSWIARNLGWAALQTDTVTGGEIWRLVTYTLVQQSPTELLFGALALFFFAPDMAMNYGERRFLWMQLAVSVGAGLFTLAVGAVLGVRVGYLGIWPLVNAMVLIWALNNQFRQVLFMFVLPISGRVLAIITIATNALYVLWGVSSAGLPGLVQFLPPLAALGIAWLIARGRIGLPLRRWRLLFREWRLERQLRRRSRHLQVVRKDGQRGPNQWMN
jgi:membrane associated rhomboid family serine protease